jgi:flagellar hook protein FlgE
MAVTSFFFSSGVNPFGGTALAGTHTVISGDATHYFASDALGTSAANPAALLNTLFDPAGTIIANTDTFQFSGTAVDGTAFVGGAGTTFTVGAGSTVQNLLDFLSDLYADGAVAGPTASANVSATLGTDGRIRIVDNTGGTSLAVTIDASVGGSLPLGANATAFTALAAAGSQINVTTSKQQVASTARGVTTAGGTTPINDSTPLDSVYDAAGVALTITDTLAFVGVRGDGTAVAASFIAGSPISGVGFGSPLTAPNNPPTMQDLLTWLEDQFHAEATIDGAGRLVLTDRVADEVAATGYHSQLEITSIAAGTVSGSEPFGTVAFATIAADTGGEDGSRVGDTMSLGFSTEALSTTQYANSSTTIFQDQNGFAAGFLQSVSVDTAGIITGNYSNGQVLERAQVALASFNNLAGLSKEGGNIFRETTASGAPITGPPATNGLGTISPNSLEQSNVDLGAEFVKLITTQRGFQANSKIITTTDEMLADLINIKR